MLMVDNLLNIDEENVTTTFLITSNGVFTAKNKLSENGLIENAAQTCSSIVGRGYFDEEDTEGETTKLIGFISAIKSVNIVSLPSVGDEIITSARLVSRFDADAYSICTMECKIECNNMILADCVMNLFIQELAR